MPSRSRYDAPSRSTIREPVPLAIVSASGDTVVDPQVHAGLARRIPGADHVVVERARHEVLMEADGYRAQFWAAFDRLARAIDR